MTSKLVANPIDVDTTSNANAAAVMQGK